LRLIVRRQSFVRPPAALRAPDEQTDRILLPALQRHGIAGAEARVIAHPLLSSASRLSLGASKRVGTECGITIAIISTPILRRRRSD